MAGLVITVLLVYTALLVLLATKGRARAGQGESFLHGGRGFGFRHVFILVTVMWASSIFVVELETGFLSGISATWFGISVIIMSILVAQFLLRPFAKAGYLTNSRLIGERFGPAARRFSALVIALTFPIFAMSNVLAAAEFLHALLGWGLPITLVATTAIMLIYVSQSGMWSLAYTQGLNLATLTVGIAVATYYFLRVPTVHLHPVHVVGFTSWDGAGLGTLAVWLVMNVLNAVSAQAEMQAIAAVREPKRGQAAVYVSAAFLVAFTMLPVWLGMRTREMLPHAAKALVAFPQALTLIAPPWAVALVALGVWAAALSWCAPLLFSGAASFGADLFKSQPRDLRKLTRYGLLIQGALVVVVALLRPDELAWWRVFGQTIRSAAIFAPTVAYFLWPLATKRATLWSMIVGVVVSLGWNAATGFSATVFLLGVNPMWVALSVAILVQVAGTLWDTRAVSITWKAGRIPTTLLALAVLTFVALAATWTHLATLRGALLCTGIVLLYFSAILSLQTATTRPSRFESLPLVRPDDANFET
ncbi:MAG: sodium:solute symporter [Firmicutes bacterium]|nr:sodium:solute symporter [Bacillota bacterium]